MPKSASKKQVILIFDYLRELMPDVIIRTEEVEINDKKQLGILISPKIDKETNEILTGLIFQKGKEYKLVKNGYMNVDTVSVAINDEKYLLLFFA